MLLGFVILLIVLYIYLHWKKILLTRILSSCSPAVVFGIQRSSGFSGEGEKLGCQCHACSVARKGKDNMRLQGLISVSQCWTYKGRVRHLEQEAGKFAELLYSFLLARIKGRKIISKPVPKWNLADFINELKARLWSHLFLKDSENVTRIKESPYD